MTLEGQDMSAVNFNNKLEGRQRYDPSHHFIREWRMARGLSTTEVAARMHPSAACSDITLARVEKGSYPYTQQILEGLAAVLDCTPADLLGRDPSVANSDG